MSVSNSTKNICKVPHREQRLESIRPFAKKFQYRQLPLPEPTKPAEKVEPAPTAEKAENESQDKS